ncbi:aminotransferase class I/II-fold pyridoxal phosphate-dependent enzyme, partial [Candidatus Saccharibacteria bacterium]|nr:aminotransferase class I/II-fold pyridoxal phosphate-dependent enzyme [Candidatus Saccharibacteria bacterium]
MKFIAHASQFGLKKTLRQLFTFGFEKDSEKLKSYIADRYQVTAENVALYGSGRTALSEAIKYFTKPGDKVAITALTCFAVVEAVRSANCEPVYLDVNLKNLHFDAKALEKACVKNPEIKAVIVQNNLAYPCDIANIESVAKKYNLALIEDLAHCVGMDYSDGREAGMVGDAVIMSFGKGKSLDLISGGLLFLRKTDKRKKSFTIPTNLPSFADRFRTRLYPLFGAITRALFHLRLGRLNFGRLYTAFLLKTHQIQKSADAKLDNSIRLTHWQAKLALRDLKKIKHRVPLRRFYFVENREELLKKLTAAGFIMDDIWYSSPVSPERYYNQANFNEKACPKAVFAANYLINLPNWLNIFELAEARHLINQYEVNLEGEKITPFTTKKSLSETEVEHVDTL